MKNKVIAIEYSLIDANTKEDLDSNVGGQPLEFIYGIGQIIPGLEEKIKTMAVGDKNDIAVDAKDAYGDVNLEAIQKLPKEQFAGVELEAGMSLYGTSEDGQTTQVVVKSFNDEEVEVDYNHPMAGKDLLFTVAILSIREATEEEIQTGTVGGMGDCGCGDGDCEEPAPKSDCGSGSCS